MKIVFLSKVISQFAVKFITYLKDVVYIFTQLNEKWEPAASPTIPVHLYGSLYIGSATAIADAGQLQLCVLSTQVNFSFVPCQHRSTLALCPVNTGQLQLCVLSTQVNFNFVSCQHRSKLDPYKCTGIVGDAAGSHFSLS